MKQFLKLMFSFAPWLAFMFIAHDSMFRLKLGLVVALALSVGMGVLKLHRGVILWAGLTFFVYATVAVVFFNHMWTVIHMGIMAHGTLALSTWYTLVIGKPFTMDYAKDHTPKEYWNNPTFIRINQILTSVWGATFTLGAFIAWHKMARHDLPDWEYEVLNYTFMLGTMAFTNWYPALVKRRAQAVAAKGDQPGA